MKDAVKIILSKIKGDKLIWAVVFVLSMVSMLAVYSSTGSLAYRMVTNPGYYLAKQVFVLGMGLMIIYFVHKVNYIRFWRIAKILYIISVPLLFITLFYGTTLNEGSRWIKLPVINLTFQTSDLAKLALFMYLARLLSEKQDNDDVRDLKKGFLPMLSAMLATCLLIAPANLSTALMLGISCAILFFIGRVRMRHLALMAAGGFMCLCVVYTVSKITGKGRAATWEQRIADFVSEKSEDGKKKEPYQVEQAKIAIANGGITGKGPGKSIQKNFLPHPYSDFIFAIIIEEYGIGGASVVVLLYLLFLWRCVNIFRRCPYAFGAFLAVGLSITLVFQALLNMAVNVNLMPVTGLTLPMISMGGSSIWFTSIAIGIILSVSRHVDEMEGKKKQEEALMSVTPLTDLLQVATNELAIGQVAASRVEDSTKRKK
jgi:cell division protein FtsW